MSQIVVVVTYDAPVGMELDAGREATLRLVTSQLAANGVTPQPVSIELATLVDE